MTDASPIWGSMATGFVCIPIADRGRQIWPLPYICRFVDFIAEIDRTAYHPG
jgi:hypothetical protein